MASCVSIKRMNRVKCYSTLQPLGFPCDYLLQMQNHNCLRYFLLSYLCYMSKSLNLPRLFVLILGYELKAAKYAVLIFVIFTILFVFSHIQIISSAFWSQTSLRYVNVSGDSRLSEDAKRWKT